MIFPPSLWACWNICKTRLWWWFVRLKAVVMPRRMFNALGHCARAIWNGQRRDDSHHFEVCCVVVAQTNQDEYVVVFCRFCLPDMSSLFLHHRNHGHACNERNKIGLGRWGNSLCAKYCTDWSLLSDGNGSIGATTFQPTATRLIFQH